MNEDLQKKYASKSVYKKDYHKVHERENVRCDVCHHKEAPEKKTGADKMKYRKCRECHDGVAKMRIMHAFCKDCHKREKRGPIHCTACHEGAGEIAVKDSVILPKTGHRKPAIYFNHKAHVELYDTECIDCHHTVKNEKCSVCHTNKDQGKVINLKEAFHQQCLDCHRKTSGPKVCGKCHVQ